MTVRIKPATQFDLDTQKTFDGIKQKMGMVPNIFKTFAHSKSVLKAYINFSSALAESSLSATIREQIALAIAGQNACNYCASAHTAIAKGQKLEEAELALNLKADSSDAKVKAALKFAKQIVAANGNIHDSDLAAIRSAGYSEQEIVEIIAVVALNNFTNYFNHIAGTEIDFPLVNTK